MFRKYNFEIEVFYEGPPNNKLDARMDFIAETCLGEFLAQTEETVEDTLVSRRVYGFNDEDNADDFREESNFIISRTYGFKPLELDDIPSRMKWSFEEAVFHHIEFEDERTAMRFATWYRAVLSTYMEPEMYDIFVVNPVNDDTGHMVVWAFPAESVIPDLSDIDDLDQELEEVMSYVNSKGDSKKVLN